LPFFEQNEWTGREIYQPLYAIVERLLNDYGIRIHAGVGRIIITLHQSAARMQPPENSSVVRRWCNRKGRTALSSRLLASKRSRYPMQGLMSSACRFLRMEDASGGISKKISPGGVSPHEAPEKFVPRPDLLTH
jgi:hypothetical protein